MTTLNQDEWIGLQQLADIAGWTLGTVYNRMANGMDMPPFYKLGRNIRFKMSDVNAWLEERRRLTATAQLKKQAADAQSARQHL
jgi:predicted DNA-binding transcriptional regulator AlpA